MPAGKFIAAEAAFLLYHQTTPSYETYTKPEKFTSFAAEKGLLMSWHIIKSRSPKF